jgi:hypothetical protein
VIAQTEAFVKKTLKGDRTAHDWFHITRVRKNALAIGRKEKANLFVVNLGALLHDIADWKFHQGDETVGGKNPAAFNGKKIFLSGDYVSGFEASAINNSIWLNFNKDVEIINPPVSDKYRYDPYPVDVWGTFFYSSSDGYGHMDASPYLLVADKIVYKEE